MKEIDKTIIEKLIKGTKEKKIYWSDQYHNTKDDTVIYTAVLRSGAKVILENNYYGSGTGQFEILFVDRGLYKSPFFCAYDKGFDLFEELLKSISARRRESEGDELLLSLLEFI